MQPFGICSDVHLHNWSQFATTNPDGLNSRLANILDELTRAAISTHNAGGHTLYITGDLFHVRGSVSPTVLNPVIDIFKDIVGEVQVRVLTGNHDLESRDSEAMSSACEALRTIEGVTVVSETKLFGDEKVAMIPWYDSMDRVRSEIESVVTLLGGAEHEWTLMLHVPVNGVIAGLPDHGFWAAELAKYGFKHVFCGHYHNFKSFEAGKVYSVGALTHQTWNDVNTKAGHLIVSDEDVQWFESKAPKFIDYDSAWDVAEAADKCAGNFVRVRLGSASDEEVTMIRDHVMALDAKGCVVQAIPVPKTAATTRTTSVASAPTVRQSIEEWVSHNIATHKEEVSKLCEEIMNEVEAVEL